MALLERRQIRVLVADDEDDLRELMVQLLRTMSSEKVEVLVESAADGGAAYKALLTQGPFALMVMDIKMPVLTGDALLKKIANENKEDIMPKRVIVVTGHHDFADLLPFADRSELLSKPFEIKQFKDSVKRAIEVLA